MNTKPSGGIVVLGAGHCGGRAAEWLRRLSFDGRVVLVGAEAWPPYERPPLSKTFLTGAKGFADCRLQDDAFYAEQGIELVTGAPATAIDPTAKQVTIGGGTKLAYDKLLIATGAIPRRLSLPGSNLDGVFTLRDRVDSEAIRAALRPGARLAVVGGGFIGLEVAASARSLGAEVVVLEAADQLLGRGVPPEVAGDVSAVHREHGVEIRLNAQVTGFLGESDVRGVTMADGQCVDATAVVVGIGVRPETSLAEACGIQSDDGILAGADCATERDDIFVAGDAARALNARYGRRIRLESWQNAEQQAEIAARAMLGQHSQWSSVPWVWSDQYEWNLQVAGFPADGERTVTRGNVSDGKVVHFALQDDQLIGAAALGQGMSAAKDLRVAQMLIEKSARPSAEALADPDINLKSLLKAR